VSGERPSPGPSLVQCLERHAAATPTGEALVTAHGRFTYGQLYAAASLGASELLAMGVPRNGLVVIAIARGPEFACAFAAAQLAGAVPAIVDPSDAAVAQEIVQRIAPAAVIGTTAVAQGALGPRVTAVARSRPDLSLWPTGARSTSSPRLVADGVSHVIFTSGSTGESKGVVWSVERAYAWATAFAKGREGASAQAKRNWRKGLFLPLCGAAGFANLFGALIEGDAVVLTDDSLPQAVATVTELGADWITCTPTQVEILLRMARDGPPLAVMVTAGPVAPERLRELASRSWVSTVFKSYAMTEIGRISLLEPADVAQRAHTTGKPYPFLRIRILDEAGGDASPGTTGEIVVELPVWTAADGYFDPSPELAARFRDGVLRTGDRGHLDADGYLIISERAAEILKVAGRSVSAVHIEDRLRELGALRDLAVVGAPNPRYTQVPALVFSPVDADLTELKARAAQLLRRDELPQWYLPRPDLPRTALGKLQRGVLSAEVERWVALWPRSLALAERMWPARDLEGPGGRHTVVDGWPLPIPAEAPGHRIALLAIEALAKPVAAATLMADGATRRIRVPFVDEGVSPPLITAFATFLVLAAASLPGAPPTLLVFDEVTGELGAMLRGLGFAGDAGQLTKAV
jgi:acyl-CoA synthetase (AMP-forming)/AMP-acid ligase II